MLGLYLLKAAACSARASMLCKSNRHDWSRALPHSVSPAVVPWHRCRSPPRLTQAEPHSLYLRTPNCVLQF